MNRIALQLSFFVCGQKSLDEASVKKFIQKHEKLDSTTALLPIPIFAKSPFFLYREKHSKITSVTFK
jgi:hypothetical protein